ncbi:MAG: hypothetical protein MHPSP_001730, partial [Paramarteilia canceri]
MKAQETYSNIFSKSNTLVKDREKTKTKYFEHNRKFGKGYEFDIDEKIEQGLKLNNNTFKKKNKKNRSNTTLKKTAVKCSDSDISFDDNEDKKYSKEGLVSKLKINIKNADEPSDIYFNKDKSIKMESYKKFNDKVQKANKNMKRKLINLQYNIKKEINIPENKNLRKYSRKTMLEYANNIKISNGGNQKTKSLESYEIKNHSILVNSNKIKKLKRDIEKLLKRHYEDLN